MSHISMSLYFLESLLKTKGLPKLGNRGASNSPPGYGHHKSSYPFTIQSGEFAVLEECRLENLRNDDLSVIWTTALQQSTVDPILPVWNNEAQIQNYIETVLRDVISLLDLTSTIHLYSRVPLAVKDLFPDIVLFRYLGFVIGIAEVKIPSSTPSSTAKDDLDNEELNNQLASYMLQLHLTHNLKEVIAIATTYDQWKLFWLEGSEWLVSATSVEGIKRHQLSPIVHHAPVQLGEHENTPEEAEALTEDIVEDGMNASFVEDDEAQLEGLANSMESFTLGGGIKERNFTIYSTQLYHYNDPKLIELLASAILKMTFSSFTEQTIFDAAQDIKYPLVKKRSFLYVYLPRDIKFKLSFSVNSKVFYLLYEFHGGRDGRVWMATTSNGNLCVIKFSHGVAASSYYSKEAQAWKDIWGVPAFELTLLGYPALVMPYCFHGVVLPNGDPFFMNLKSWGKVGPFLLDDFVNNGSQNQISKRSLQYYLKDPIKTAQFAIQEMANRGYKHDDLKFQHVGLLPYSNSGTWKVRPILLDLHEISKIHEKESIDQIIQAGIEKIVNSLSLK